MRTTLIAQKSSRFAEALATPLRSAGSRAVTCPGPWPPALRCIRCDVGYCPLTEAADLLIYDPELIGYDGDAQRDRSYAGLRAEQRRDRRAVVDRDGGRLVPRYSTPIEAGAEPGLLAAPLGAGDEGSGSAWGGTPDLLKSGHLPRPGYRAPVVLY